MPIHTYIDVHNEMKNTVVIMRFAGIYYCVTMFIHTKFIGSFYSGLCFL